MGTTGEDIRRGDRITSSRCQQGLLFFGNGNLDDYLTDFSLNPKENMIVTTAANINGMVQKACH